MTFDHENKKYLVNDPEILAYIYNYLQQEFKTIKY